MLVTNPSGGFFEKCKCRRAGPCSLIHQLLSKRDNYVGFVAAGGSKDG